MSDISELPLKPTQITFVDDPESIDDVNLTDLTFQLKNGMKSVTNIHIFEVLKLFSVMLQDIIKLQGNRDLFEAFRRKLLQKYGVEVSDLPLNPSTPDINVLKFSSSDSIDDKLNLKFSDSNDEIISDVADEVVAFEPQDCDDEDSPYQPFNMPISKTLSKNFEELEDFEPTLNFRIPHDDYENADGKLVHCDLSDDDEDDNRNGIDIKFVHRKRTYSQVEPAPEIIDIQTLVEASDLTPVQLTRDFRTERLRHEIFKKRSQTQTSQLLKTFNLVNIPPLTVDEFLLRIKTYSSAISTSCYIHAAFMMFKLCIILDMIPLTLFNVYRFILASIRCSTKKLEDVYQKQKAFATVGGVSLKELFKIEVGFLYLCNFKLGVGEDLMNEFLANEYVELRTFMDENFAESGN